MSCGSMDEGHPGHKIQKFLVARSDSGISIAGILEFHVAGACPKPQDHLIQTNPLKSGTSFSCVSVFRDQRRLFESRLFFVVATCYV